jgi:hypothetical protein
MTSRAGWSTGSNEPKNRYLFKEEIMGDIIITVSEKEMRLLLKHVALANWMLESHKIETDDEGRENAAIYHKILALAHENGLPDGIVYENELKNYLLTEEKEEEFQQFIDAYNYDVFWDILADELASRDFLERHGEKAIGAMDAKKRFTLLSREADKYDDEFVEHGVDHLRIVK